MEIVNITPREIRRIFWHIIAGISVLVVVFKVAALL